MFFHRNPALSLKEPDENILYSPASGKIIDISPKGDNLLKISIFLSISDNHTQYIPMRCKKIGELFKYGYFYFAQKMEGSDYNQSLSHLLETKYGNITIIQYTGFFTRRIYSLTKNDRLYNVGDRLGYIRFGSRVDIILPLDKFDSVFVKKGQHIKALEPLAMFK
jgi:phosphatidylserine decarboxylase